MVAIGLRVNWSVLDVCSVSKCESLFVVWGGGSEISAQTHMAAAMWPKDASLGSRQEGALKLDWRAGRSLGCG